MCFTPFGVKDKLTKETIPVPCGKCPQCIARRINGWAFRLEQEQKVSDSSNFITLTYDTLHVPLNKRGYMDLSKRDVQLYIKRLRKLHTEYERYHKTRLKPIKYYAVGEYGGTTYRPHYHIILFNAKLELIQPAWQKGHIHYGKAETASMLYCLKYMEKKSYKPSKEFIKTKFGGSYEMYKEHYTEPEFSLMSKGLGVSYLTSAKMRWHYSDLVNRMYLPIQDGKKIALPRYYRNKLYLTEKETNQVKFYNRSKFKKELENEIELGGLTYFRDKSELHLQKFKRMHEHAIKSRNKI